MSDSASESHIADYAPVEVTFSPKPSFRLLFDGLHVEQELGRPFLIQLEVSSGTVKANAADLLGATCAIWLYEEPDETEQNRYFHGIVTRVISAGLSGGAYRFKLEVRPWVWLLSQTQDCRIFQKMSAFQIVTKVFRDAGFSDFQDKRQGGAGDIQLEYCVQYRETSLDFVTRLMEQFGFYYHFTFDTSSHTLVIVDDPNAHPLLKGDLPFRYDQTEYRHVADHLWDWSSDLALLSGKWTFQDYNFTTPSADLTAKTVQMPTHKHNDHEIFEYPGPYDTASDGHRLSDVRMQAISGRRVVSAAQSNSRGLLCGWRFKMKDHPNQPLNRDYLAIRSSTSVGGIEGTPNPNAETLDTYRVQVHCIPADKPFRLERRTPRPMIRGPQTARVVGKPGEEITTDEYGRVKVRFHWDHSDTQDENRTCWIRVAQTWAGSGWGTLFIPRVDQEVVVEFLEGNPDRPLITGVVYNANNKVPYTLPDNKTQAGMKTSSSPGGSGANEFRMEDKAGAEEVYLHAQYDYKKEVKHDEKVTVTNDRTHTVSTGNDKLTVSSGNHTLDVSAGTSAITAAQSITLTVGGNSIKIDTTGVTINGMKIDVQSTATMSLQAGASMTLQGATIAIN